MGCVSSSAQPLEEKEFLVDRDHEQTSWERLGGGELEQPLRDDLVKCVHSRYLVKLFQRGGRIERMQDLPASAFINLEALKKLGTCKKRAFSEEVGTVYEWLPIAILSYSWLGRAHPDPYAETLEVLVKALKRMGDYGVIIDFASLPQVPRTEEEDKRFKSGLQKLNIFYSHPHTLVFQVTDFPFGYPSKNYDLPEGHLPARYPHRGWCYAEACISSLGKPPKFLCNLSRLGPDWEREVVGKCMNEKTNPPLTPSVFNDELSKKTFTKKKTDFARVQKLYEDAFNSRIGNSETLLFARSQWEPAEVQGFSQVIRVNQVMRQLDLSGNNVGLEGIVALSRTVEAHPTLKILRLGHCNLHAAELSVLAEMLKVNTVLAELGLRDNIFGVEGAQSLAEALKVNTSLTCLTLSHNNRHIAQPLAEALKVNTALTELDLSHCIVQDEGAHSLAEALRVNTTLTVLSLYHSSIGDAGAHSLAEALKVNTTLAFLDVSMNLMHDQAEQCVEKAARKGCTVVAKFVPFKL